MNDEQMEPQQRTAPSRRSSGRRRMRPPWKRLTTRGKQQHRHHRPAAMEAASTTSFYGAVPNDGDDDGDGNDALDNNDPSLTSSAASPPRRFSSRRHLLSASERRRRQQQDTLLPHHYQQQQTDTTTQQVVVYFEQTLRIVCGAAMAFLLGVWFPRYVSIVEKIAEYAVVAWITCGIIRVIVAVVVNKKKRNHPAESVQDVVVEEEFDEEEALYGSRGEHEPLLRRSQEQPRQRTAVVSIDDVGGDEEENLRSSAADNDDDDEQDLSSSRNDIIETPIQSAKVPSSTSVTPIPLLPTVPSLTSTQNDNQYTTNVHPALDPYFVIDTTCGRRVLPNIPGYAFPLETDYFKGQMMILIRTPNVDDITQPVGKPDNVYATNYLANKQRRFEFQFQLKLKKVPTGRVYFACELQKSVKMGMIQRAFVSAAMAFVKSTNSSFHYNITGSSSSTGRKSSSTNDAAATISTTTSSLHEDGRYERPHMAFPVEEGMNRVVATPPGQPLPVLGQEIVEDAESLKQRKKGIAWNMDDTYTMSLWSAYVDFLDWRCMNLPGIRPFGLLNIIGRQPIYLTLYEMPLDRENMSSKNHYRCDMIRIVEFEMCNARISGVGEAAQKWLTANPLLTANGNSGSVMLTKRDSAESLGGMADDEAIFPEDMGGPETEEEEQLAAELGEGIYLCSGDAITLKETIIGAEGSIPEQENEASCFVVNGGGFAVLQERSSSTIIIEKTGLSRRSLSRSANSGIIRSGDTVLFKLVTRENSKGIERETKFLSLHRGWWLKWVSAVPTKNGFFTVHSTSKESQSSYLTLGGSFYLKHKRWSSFFVGVAREGSATYGGRMLGLYNPKQTANQEYEYITEEDEVPGETEQLDPENKSGPLSILPLYLEACDPVKDARATTQPEITLELSSQTGTMKRLLFSCEDTQTDVPAWLEVLNRTERVRQLVYVVRIKPLQKDATSRFDDSEDPPSELVPIMRLRTGKELSEVMRVGLHWRDKTASPRRRKNSAEVTGSDGFSNMVRSLSRDELPTTPTKDSADQRSVKSDGQVGDELDIDEECSYGDFPLYDEAEMMGGEDEFDISVEDSLPNRPRKSRKFIGKIAKSVKTKTATTGKQVVKVGRGTVNAGKAIVSGRPKNLPREPNSVKLRSRRKVERDLRVSVSNKAIKRVEKNESQLESNSDAFSDNIAGELSASEQSCRTVSKMLSRMSSVTPTSPAASEFSPLLASHLEIESDLDVMFLQGSSLELGVVPLEEQDSSGLVFDCIVARCLWESHWREEWCGVYHESIKFYAPLTNVPCLEVPYEDIKAIRMVDPKTNPLPGAAILAVESSWLIHYIALGRKETRQILKIKLEELINKLCDLGGPPQTERDIELSKARLWQDLQRSLEASRLIGRGKWAQISSGQKRTNRVILNNRRMVFDLYASNEEMESLVEGLLSTALSFTLNSLQDHPEELSSFLNNCSKLRGLSLQDLESASPSTLCTLVNLYHCLLQHALLFTPNGPLTKRTYENFMRTCCYEIGEDVYSLAELNSCIIRGHMSRPTISKPPYIEAPRRSASYRSLALRTTTPHLNFLLNTGDVSCTRKIPVLTFDRLEEFFAVQTAEFLKKNVIVNVSKKQVFLPKVCEVYRNDFCTDPSTAAITCLEFCLQHLEEPIASTIRHLLQTEAALSIKYLPAADQYFTTLAQACLPDTLDGDDPEIEDKD